MWSAAPQTTLWGGSEPRFKPGTGSLEAWILTTRPDHYTSLFRFRKDIRKIKDSALCHTARSQKINLHENSVLGNTARSQTLSRITQRGESDSALTNNAWRRTPCWLTLHRKGGKEKGSGLGYIKMLKGWKNQRSKTPWHCIFNQGPRRCFFDFIHKLITDSMLKNTARS